MTLTGEQGLSTVSATPESSDTGLPADRYEGFSSPDPQESDANPATPEDGDAELETTIEQTEPDPWEGYEDYELNGVIKKVPSEWKENLMLKADHTRRLQEVAESRKQVQAREAELSQRFQQTEEEFNTHLELAGIRNQLKQAEGINWTTEYQRLLNDPRQSDDYLAWDKDVKQFNAIQMQFRDLKEQEAALTQKADGLAKTRIETGQQEISKRLSATLEFAQSKIKGWTPELDQKITQFAMSEGGYDAETLKNGMTPQNYKMLHLAYLGHQSQLRQQTAKPTQLAKPIAPTQTVSAKVNPAVAFDPERSSMDDYAKDWQARQKRKQQ